MRKQKPTKPKAKLGRPATVTVDVVEKMGHWIALGMSEEQACIAEGVNYKTWESAKKRPEFSGAVKWAQVEFLKRALPAIANGGEEIEVATADGGARIERRPWTGLAWLLERRHKPQFDRAPSAVAIAASGSATFTITDEIMRDLQRAAREQFVDNHNTKQIQKP